MNQNSTMILQVLDWTTTHIESDDGTKYFIIRLFGMTENNKTICVEVTRFMPYFYIEIPEYWTKHEVTILLSSVKQKLLPEFRDNYVKYEIENMCKFWGFTAGKKFKYIRLSFLDYFTFLQYQYVFARPIYVLGNHIHFQLFESNIEPMLRCMHGRKLLSCGWLSVSNYELVKHSDANTSCEVNIITEHTSLHYLDGKESDIQPFTIAAFDIECVSEDGTFPQPERDNDKIIMIATTFSRYGENDCYYKNVIVLGDCNAIAGADVQQCKTESGLLKAWAAMMRKQNPDFVTGWNIFGFDEVYIYERCKKLDQLRGTNILESVSQLSRLNGIKSEFITKELSSSALGENVLHFFDMTGRVHFDLMKVVQKDYKLGSYKLDFVSSTFFREIITGFKIIGDNTLLKTKGTYGFKEGQYTTIIHNDGVTDYEHMNGKKFKVLKIEKNAVIIEGNAQYEPLEKFLNEPKHKIFWCQVKDDVKPKEIFNKFNGTIDDRTDLAMYNIQDCELCNKLVAKLQVVVDNMCMANVCNVPISYLFMRGQGIKVFSLVSKKCREKGYVIPVIKKKNNKNNENNKNNKNNKDNITNKPLKCNKLSKNEQQNTDEDEDTGFEGAIVFDPIPGLYLNPIFVLDFASLYPNSMRFRNLSHECIVIDKKYNNLPNYEYTTVKYTNTNKSATVQTCIFAKAKDGTPGILPEILTDLLDARSRTRKMIETEKDPFKKKVLDRMQLAYKVTANSLYGQTGAPTSAIFMKDIAACTTSTGREMLIYSRTFIEIMFNSLITYALDNVCEYFRFTNELFTHAGQFGYIPTDKKFMYAFDNCTLEKRCQRHGMSSLCKCDIRQPINNWQFAFSLALLIKIRRLMKGYHIKMKVIYGDTDSVFVDPHIISDETNKLQTDTNALSMAMQLGIIASMVICTLLPEPMKQEYEKTLYPFVQLSKKRYVGNLYEKDITKFEQKSMGIVLKRRDNAPIVKIVYGGIIDQMINKRNPLGAIQFTKQILRDIMSGKYPMDKFIITKTLRTDYKRRSSIAHAVLADRMAARDPGNKPASNDRIPYVYIVTKHKVKLQGDKIETPDYVIQNKLKIDYRYYIERQIMKPVLQLLGLIADKPNAIFDKIFMIDTNNRNGMLPISYYC